MKDLLYLSMRHALHHRLRTAILVLCLAVAAYLPTIVQILSLRYEASLTARAASTPLVMGAKGNRFDLTLGTLYFRPNALDPIPYREYQTLASASAGLAIPMNLRFSARSVPIVAAGLEYLDVRGLEFADGTPPLRVGDAILGSAAARELDAGVGDTVYSDQSQAFDIAEAPSIALRVTGVLEAAGTPDDHAIFVDIRSAWLLEGAMHGHEDAESIDPRMIFAETDEGAVLNSAVRELNQITPDTAQRFHVHGDEGDLPLSAVLLFPASEKDGTIVKARMNASQSLQMLVPSEVIDDLLGFVFRIKGFLDLVAGLLAASVGLMTLLVMLLTVRLRAPEMRTINHIGAGRFTTLGLYACELGLIVALSLVLAGAGVTLSLALLPDLVTAL